MRSPILLRLCCLVMTLLALPARADNHIAARLVAESMTPAAGSEVTLALDMIPAPGWHGYWSNPGEAGFPARFAWTLPPGAAVGAPDYPVPTTLMIAGLMNHVFEGEHALIFRLRTPAGLKPGAALPIRLAADWLACTDRICVPEHGEFALDLTIGDGARSDPRFDAWRAALPAPLAAGARFARVGHSLRVAIPYPAGAVLRDPHIFALSSGMLIEAARQQFHRRGDVLIATLATPAGADAASLGAVLAIGGGRGLAFTATPGPVPIADDGDDRNSLAAVIAAIGAALLGGLILNVMPCVFPILSLKALSLARAGTDEHAARRDALAYAAGAMATCAALGAAMLALKAGWAFQLQDARVVLALMVLVAALALNLAGVFELPALGGSGAHGGFLTGALAAFVATPCTGPFMGAALGAALVLSAPAAIGVFAGLGLGLALPFLAIGFVPALRRRLPRPGAWTARLRHILAVPMALTALWLGWLLWRQSGPGGLWLGLAAVAGAALALGWAGRRQRGGQSGLGAVVLVGIAAVLSASALLPAAPAPAVTTDRLGAEPFSEARLAALRAQGRPVFVYFTADWCLTCKVNERGAIDRAETEASFRRGHVATLVGDWTRADPVIGRFLNAHGRAGVPLYLYYRPGAAEPETLPQLLTPALLAGLTA